MFLFFGARVLKSPSSVVEIPLRHPGIYNVVSSRGKRDVWVRAVGSLTEIQLLNLNLQREICRWASVRRRPSEKVRDLQRRKRVYYWEFRGPAVRGTKRNLHGTVKVFFYF